MRIFRQKYFGKLFLLIFAVAIGLGSLFYTNSLVRILKEQERKNVQIWAEATIRIFNQTDQDVDPLLSSIIENNNTVPVILTDENDSLISARNFKHGKSDEDVFLRKKLSDIKEENEPIIINLDKDHFNKIYYTDSIILTMLIYYPYAQLGIILMFILVSYLAFRSSRKAEQNQVWVALSRETAHQLGTPTSSLAGWVEVLQQKYPGLNFTKELHLDVLRLEKVTERFSRIGSKPSLSEEDISGIINNAVDYLKSRTSSKVTFQSDPRSRESVYVPVNPALFEWVIEVICKNAIDAMEGSGTITILVSDNDKQALIDISDTGKGIPKSAFKKIFNTGFTTKKRGWGVGLSLARRIIEEYHHGKIFVRSSELGKGSSIRIVMNK